MFLLENVDTIPYPKRSLFYTIILSLIKRYEFDMIHFESSKLDIGNHGIDLDVMKQVFLFRCILVIVVPFKSYANSNLRFSFAVSSTCFENSKTILYPGFGKNITFIVSLRLCQ